MEARRSLDQCSWMSNLHDLSLEVLQNRGACQQIAMIEDLCDPHVSHKWLKLPDDFAVGVQKDWVNEASLGRALPPVGSADGTQRGHAAQRQQREDTTLVSTRYSEVSSVQTCDTNRTARTHRTDIKPGDMFSTAAAVPGDGAALYVCVTSSNTAASRGDAAHAAFDRKISTLHS